MKQIFFIITVILAPVLAWATPQATLKVDRSAISLSETATLLISVENAIDSEYPTLHGGQEFEVSTIGPDTRIEIINGSVKQSITYRYRLMPKKVGTFSSPSATVRVGNEVITLSSVMIKVSKGADLAAGEVDSVQNFAVQTLSSKEVYQGQQVDYELTSFSLEDPVEFKPESYAFDGFWMEEFGKLEKGRTKIRGKQFHTVRSRMALFPISAGKFTVPLRRISLKVRERQKFNSQFRYLFGMDPFSDPFFSSTVIGIGERIIQAPEISITAKPLPPKTPLQNEIAPEADIVGATSITLSGDVSEIKYGDSATLSVTIQSEGNLNPISSLNIPSDLGFRVYEDPPTKNQFESAGKIVSEKTFKFSLVPERGGDLFLPSLKLQFFNPENGKYEIADTRGLKFLVTGAPEIEIKSETSAADSNLLSESRSQTPGDSKQIEPKTQALNSFYKGLFRKVSPQTIGLLFLSTLVLAAVVFSAFGFFSRINKKASLRSEILMASDITTLARGLNKIIERYTGIFTEGLSSEAIKAEIRGKCKDNDLAFALQNMLDELDLARYGSSKTGDIEHFKSRLVKLV